jgi:hypothetical protein
MDDNANRLVALGSLLPWLSREEIESEVDKMIHDRLLAIDSREAAILELRNAAERSRAAVKQVVVQTVCETLDSLRMPPGKKLRDLEQRVLELELHAYPEAKEPPTDFGSSRRV